MTRPVAISGEVAVFGTKNCGRRSRQDITESVISCHDHEVVGHYLDSNLVQQNVLATKADYTIEPWQRNTKCLLKSARENQQDHCADVV